MAAQIGIDEDIKILESTRPNANADSFLSILDHDAAGAVGLSYYRLTGRYESTSYTAVRGAHLDDDAHFRPLQNWFGRGICVPMRREFQALAVASGLFNTVSPVEYRRNQRKYRRFDAIGPGREMLDPEKETEAAISKLRSGLTTLKIECARRGLHWLRVLRQVKMENRIAELYGIVLDFSKGQGGQVNDSTRNKTSEGATDD
jgi:capsid protein